MEPAGTPDIRGIIFDLDHTLYKHGDKRFELYALATAQAALNMGLSATFEQAQIIAIQSNEETGGEFTHFVERHGLPARELLHEYDKVAARIFPDYVEAVEGLADKFNRLSADRKRAVLTHSSSHWMNPMIQHVGLGASFDPNLLFPQDHPDIQYRKKNESPEVFELVAKQMGVPLHQIAVVEDTPKNLILPYLLGMHTVLVTWGEYPEQDMPWVCEIVNSVSDFLRPEHFPELAP